MLIIARQHSNANARYLYRPSDSYISSAITLVFSALNILRNSDGSLYGGVEYRWHI